MLLLQAHDTHGAGFFLFLSMPMGLVTDQDSSVVQEPIYRYLRSLYTFYINKILSLISKKRKKEKKEREIKLRKTIQKRK